MSRNNRGFIGLLSLLIAGFLIALYLFTYTTKEKIDENYQNEEQVKTRVEESFDAIDKAYNAKESVEARHR